jgi:hypothetical protein
MSSGLQLPPLLVAVQAWSFHQLDNGWYNSMSCSWKPLPPMLGAATAVTWTLYKFKLQLQPPLPCWHGAAELCG